MEVARGEQQGDGAITAADVAAFLEQGALDVLVALYRSQPGLYALLGDLVRDERIGVRLGASALVEELAAAHPAGREPAAAALFPLLEDADAVRRGDAAYLLGVVGGPAQLTALRELAERDQNADVREIAQEAVDQVRSRYEVAEEP